MRKKYDLSLLYVEDEDMVRTAMSSYFQRRFRDLHSASNGKEGIEKYNELKPDIIVTDIEMPLMDGFKMSTLIRQDNANVPIIFTTAFSEPEQLQKAKELRVHSYVLKPIDREELDGIIGDIAEMLLKDRG